MSTTNPVYQVLITSGNQAPLATGQPLTALLPGQIGVISKITGLALGSGSSVAEGKEFFLAVGVNRIGTNVLQDINGNAGQYIQAEGVGGYTLRCASVGQPDIYDLKDFAVKCETEYSLKIEFRNHQIYAENGYNQFTKTWVETGGCCEGDCVDCTATGDGNAMVTRLKNQINQDPDGLVIAAYLDYTTDPLAPVVVADADYADWIADPANAEKTLGLRLTSVPLAVQSYYDINMKYVPQRGTALIITPSAGFLCNHTLTQVQELKYAEGSGYDLRQQEYFAGGWNGKPGPYRVSALNGVAAQGFEYFASATAQYTQIILGNDFTSQSNFAKYDANLQTIIGIPCADSTTRNGLVAILDKILPQFAPNTGLSTSAACDCTSDDTEDLTVANNGIKIVA